MGVGCGLSAFPRRDVLARGHRMVRYHGMMGRGLAQDDGWRMVRALAGGSERPPCWPSDSRVRPLCDAGRVDGPGLGNGGAHEVSYGIRLISATAATAHRCGRPALLSRSAGSGITHPSTLAGLREDLDDNHGSVAVSRAERQRRPSQGQVQRAVVRAEGGPGLSHLILYGRVCVERSRRGGPNSTTGAENRPSDRV